MPEQSAALNQVALEGWISEKVPIAEHTHSRWALLQVKAQGKMMFFAIVLPLQLRGVSGLEGWDRIKIWGKFAAKPWPTPTGGTHPRPTVSVERLEVVSKHTQPETHLPWVKGALTTPPPVDTPAPAAPVRTPLTTVRPKRTRTRKVVTQQTPSPLSPRLAQRLTEKGWQVNAGREVP